MKSYKQYCGVAKALDIVGQRWMLLILRNLVPGPQRFTDLRVAGLTANVLSDRLQHLQSVGLVERQQLPPPAARPVWALTEQGRSIEPVIHALGAFGAQFMGDIGSDQTDVRWMMVSLGRRYRGGMAPQRVGILADGQPFTLVIDPEHLRARDGHTEDVRARICGDKTAIARALVRGFTDRKDLQIDGEAAALDELIAAITA